MSNSFAVAAARVWTLSLTYHLLHTPPAIWQSPGRRTKVCRLSGGRGEASHHVYVIAVGRGLIKDGRKAVPYVLVAKERDRRVEISGDFD